MKQIRYLLPVSVAVGIFLCLSVRADVFRESQIVEFNTGNLGVPGTGASDGWENANANVVVTNGSGSLDGSGLGLVASDGDKVSISATFSLSARNLIAPLGTFPQATDTNIYFSFLYRFNVATDVTNNGQVVMRMNRGNSGTGTPQHWDLIAKSVAGQVQLGIAKANGITNYATTNLSAGQTFFVVVRQHIIPGVQNDVYDLWINPPASTFFTNEANVPPSSASVGAVTTDGTEDASNTGPGRLVLASGANANFDELRVGGTWADVTPFFGQCIPAGINISPASQTNTAELAFTFAVVKRGTSANFQWQRSTDGGTVWNSISGANSRTYTTPNLALPESGSKYRVIIDVPCDSSSATSGVATVTLKVPTITPVGLVMDDFFDDQIRDNTPVTISNSVWRTAVAANLDAISGNMVATPTGGGSSLFLGYFTESNAVHLDIGRQIKVTLVFTPNSFNSFTNNAGLRFGLLDYADGGTRLITDSALASGSAGNGIGVRGYMLTLDFGTNFTANSPLQLLVRNNLDDINLLGSAADFISLGSGPAGGGYTGAPAFQPGTPYTLEFTVTRTETNSVDIAATISGGGTNWSHTVTETNLAYHRFDAFGIRPNSLETSADSFTIPEFKVEVLPVTIAPASINLTSISRAGNNVTLNWTPTPAGTFSYTVQRKTALTNLTWTTLQSGISTTTYTDTTATGAIGFYRISSP